MESKNLGTDLFPKYILNAKIIGVNGNYDLKTFQYSFIRKIEGRDQRFIEIALTNNNSIIDIPFKEGEITEKDEYHIVYKVIGEFSNGRTFDSLNQNEVYFDYVLDEQEEEKGSFPVYAIVIIIGVSLAIIAVGSFLIYKFLFKKKNSLNEVNQIESVKKSEIDSEIKPKSSRRTISSQAKIINYQENN